MAAANAYGIDVLVDAVLNVSIGRGVALLTILTELLNELHSINWERIG